MSSVPAKATVDGNTGIITGVEAGNTTISYKVVENATDRVVAKGQQGITVQAAIVD
jgi:uncharacterized protein YjdB